MELAVQGINLDWVATQLEQDACNDDVDFGLISHKGVDLFFYLLEQSSLDRVNSWIGCFMGEVDNVALFNLCYELFLLSDLDARCQVAYGHTLAGSFTVGR